MIKYIPDKYVTFEVIQNKIVLEKNFHGSASRKSFFLYLFVYSSLPQYLRGIIVLGSKTVEYNAVMVLLKAHKANI